jgi:long-chain acyl-CoA synthetase
MFNRISAAAAPAAVARLASLSLGHRLPPSHLRRGFQTLVELQQAACTKYADRPFLGTRVQGKAEFSWMSYQQVADDINRAKSAMQTAGVGKGSVVAIIANNRREWVVAAYASLALGAQFVPMCVERLSYSKNV